jgi:hypothetical protein
MLLLSANPIAGTEDRRLTFSDTKGPHTVDLNGDPWHDLRVLREAGVIDASGRAAPGVVPFLNPEANANPVPYQNTGGSSGGTGTGGGSATGTGG